MSAAAIAVGGVAGAAVAVAIAPRPELPVTPFHLGPALLVKGIAPGWFSWSAFVASQVVIDLESLYHLARDEYPVHRTLHTLIGATLAGLATAVGLLGARAVLRRAATALARTRLGTEITPRAIVIGALFGGASHPLLDGVMHADVRPFAPFSDANPWLGSTSLGVLHYACVISGLVGAIVLVFRPDRDGS